MHFKIQTQHYQFGILFHSEIENDQQFLSYVKDCETIKYLSYLLINHLIRLVLILLVLTVTYERSFLVMKIVKSRLTKKRKDEFITKCLTTYIERKIAKKCDTNSIIHEIYNMKKRRVQLK